MTQHRGHIKVDKKIQQITIDPQYGCLYLQFSGEKIAKTVQHSPAVNIDLNKGGGLVGIEFVGVKKSGGNFKQVFVELAKVYNRPELKNIPTELKHGLAFVSKAA